MPRHPRSLLAVALLAGLAACQENKEAPATHEPSEAPTPGAVTPGSGVTTPAASPSGAQVGAAGADATATTAPGDSAQAAAAHP